MHRPRPCEIGLQAVLSTRLRRAGLCYAGADYVTVSMKVMVCVALPEVAVTLIV